MIGAIHSVTRATVLIPPKITIAENTKRSAAMTRCALDRPPNPAIGSRAEGLKAERRVEAMALDCTEVMTNAQVTTVMMAKMLARILFFIPRAM